MPMWKIGVALVVLVGCASAAVAQVPPAFTSVWLYSGVSDSQCSNADWARRSNDALVNVTPKSVEFWETSCNVLSFRILKSQSAPGGTAETTLACRGEGMTWRTREIWSLQKLGSRRVLAMVQLQRSGERNETQKPSTTLQDNVHVAMYLECK
jgi:hypothetical protein